MFLEEEDEDDDGVLLFTSLFTLLLLFVLVYFFLTVKIVIGPLEIKFIIFLILTSIIELRVTPIYIYI